MDINHNPYTKRHILSIDSRFRDPVYTNPADYIFKLSNPIKNVISIRLSSIEFPNTYFLFSDFNGNTQIKFSFNLSGGIVAGPYYAKIAEGNYSTITGDITSIIYNVQVAMRAAYIADIGTVLPYDPVITLSLSPITGYVTIYSEGMPAGSPPKPPMNFTLDFTYTQIVDDCNKIVDPTRLYDWGLGYNLGFEKKIYTGASSYTGSIILDVLGAGYVLFQLDDYDPVIHLTPVQAQISAFAKIILTGEKNTMVYDDGFNLVTKHYIFPQPTNIYKFHPRLVNTYGETLYLNGKNVSFTLEIEEVTNTHAYEQYRLERMDGVYGKVATFLA